MNYEELIAKILHENQALKSEITLLTARCNQYADAHEYLQEQIIQLRRQMFGTKSERYIDPENKQPSLFDEDTFAIIDNQPIEELTTKVTAHTRIRTCS